MTNIERKVEILEGLIARLEEQVQELRLRNQELVARVDYLEIGQPKQKAIVDVTYTTQP
jgi:hypothetical protein